MGTDSGDPSRSSGRQARPDLEEGEFVRSDDDSAGSDGDSRSVVQHRHGGGGDDARPEIKGRGLEEGAPPSSTPSCERDSDGTISDLEEGEIVASDDDSAGSDGDIRSVVQHRHGGGGGDDARPEIKGPGLEGVVVDGGIPLSPTPTPSSERDTDGTISDVVDADAGAASLAQGPRFFPVCCDLDGTISDADAGAASPAQGPRFFPCPVCREEFRSECAMHGHRRVHVPPGREQGNKEPTLPVISGGWAVTAKRSSVQRRSSSAEPSPPNVASSDNPTNQVVVHPPCSPQCLQGYQPAAPQVVVAQAQPSVAQGQQLAEAAAPQFGIHHPAPPQVVAHHQQRPSSPDYIPLPMFPARFWLCKVEGCGQRFTTGAGLGGHMSGSKHGPRVSPKKRRAKPKVSAPELASALAPSLPMPPAAMEVAPAQTDVAPRVPGVLRLFGVNIVPGEPPASAAEEVSSTVTEADQSSAASNNSEQ